MTGKQYLVFMVICKKGADVQCQNQPAMRWALTEAAETAQVPLQLFSISTSEVSLLSGILWRQVTSDDYVSLSNNRIEEWEFRDRIVLPSRLYPITTNRGKANTLLSATTQGFLFGFHFDNGNLEASWERWELIPTKRSPGLIKAGHIKCMDCFQGFSSHRILWFQF